MSNARILKKHLDGGKVNIRRLADDLGILYRERPMPGGQSGKFAYDGWNYIITVNSNEIAQRRRFSAAHEIGHFFLHRDLLDVGEHMDRLFTPKKNPPKPFEPYHETQANAFAADLLMPEDQLTKAFRENDNARDLAKQFEVSPLAMKWRLYNLGLTDKKPA